MFLTSVIVFFIVGREWDALHLYIANNLDWMMVWIEQSQENGTQMVLDLIYGLRDTKVHIRLLIITHKFNINSQIDANNLDMFE